METLQEQIEDAEYNIAQHRADALRLSQMRIDFQAIADDPSQPIYRREKFAVHALWATGEAEAAKNAEYREQKRLDDLVIERRAEKAERDAQFAAITGIGPSDFPSAYMRSGE